MAGPLDQLDESQTAAATYRGDGPLLIHGAAGTGKSSTIAARAAWLVTAERVPAEQIVVLVATPAAARRIRTRLSARLPNQAASVSVTTLPDLCHQLLREVGGFDDGLSFDAFSLPATRSERVAILAGLRQELGLLHHDGGPKPIPFLASAVARIDRLKESLVGLVEFETWVSELAPDDPRLEREREFLRILALHDRALAERGLVDHGELLLRLVNSLNQDATAKLKLGNRIAHILVDDVQDLPSAGVEVLFALTEAGVQLSVAGDDDQAIRRNHAAASRNLREIAARFPDQQTASLERCRRSPQNLMQAAESVVQDVHDRMSHRWFAPSGGELSFWRATNERAQAQATAESIERLIRSGTPASQIAVLVGSVRRDAGPVLAALSERATPHKLGGEGAFLERVEVRDVLAWLRILIDPADPPALSRALARGPIELRSADLARCLQIARRDRNDLVGALAAVLDSPQVAPEARDRVATFLRLYRSAQKALDTMPPDQFIYRLIDHLGLRRAQIFSTNGDVIDRLRDLARVGELAERFSRVSPGSSARAFAEWMAVLAEISVDPAGKIETVPFAFGGTGLTSLDLASEDESRQQLVRVLPIEAAADLEVDHLFVLGLQEGRLPDASHKRLFVDPLPEELVPGAETEASSDALRDEARRVLHVAITRARRGVVLSYAATSTSGASREPVAIVEQAVHASGAQWEDREEQLFGPDDELHARFRLLREQLIRDVATIGARLGDLRIDTDLDVAHGVSRYLELLKVAALIKRPDGQELADALPGIDAAIRQAATSQQKEILSTSGLDGDLVEVAAVGDGRKVAAKREPSLAPFLSMRGEGLLLSATDIQTYLACPLRYKFAKVLRVPQQPTTAQRFGILVHQVLERWHGRGGTQVEELQQLLESGWRRSGLAGVADEERLRVRATQAMETYFARSQRESSEPVWLERSFEFRLGPHTLRGRVDRVDRHTDGGYELIDYKTGRPVSEHDLKNDIQLQLYTVAARESWGLDRPQQTYHYVLDDKKVSLEVSLDSDDRIKSTVDQVAGAVLNHEFEPTPSYEACSFCDYRLSCPAVET